MTDKLSPTMLQALDYMREHSELRRYPGGFWSRFGWKGPSDGVWFGASTVNALESRGLIKWTGWQARKGGQSSFPIAARIAERETNAT